MDNLQSVPPREILRPMVHCWDIRARKMVCGATGHIGSTKHVRDVTCEACLRILGRAPHGAFQAVQQ